MSCQMFRFEVHTNETCHRQIKKGTVLIITMVTLTKVVKCRKRRTERTNVKKCFALFH